LRQNPKGSVKEWEDGDDEVGISNPHYEEMFTCQECTNTRKKDERRVQVIWELKLRYGSDPVPQEQQYKQDLIANVPLYAAVYFSDADLVHELLHCGEEINFEDDRTDCGTTLQLAAFQGDENMIKLLVVHGAVIDQEGGRYGSVLQAAAAEGHATIVNLLLELNGQNSMDLNRQEGVSGSALQAAASKGHTEAV
jgi:hypothetical protein